MTLYRFVTVDPLKFLIPFGIGSKFLAVANRCDFRAPRRFFIRCGLVILLIHVALRMP